MTERRLVQAGGTEFSIEAGDPACLTTIRDSRTETLTWTTPPDTLR